MHPPTHLHNPPHRLLNTLHRKRRQHRHLAAVVAVIILLPSLQKSALRHLQKRAVDAATGSAEPMHRDCIVIVVVAFPAQHNGVECGSAWDGEDGDLEPADCSVLWGGNEWRERLAFGVGEGKGRLVKSDGVR